MTMRNEVVKVAQSWVGLKRSDGSFKVIIDTYNGYKGKFPRGIKMKYEWNWCACTWSAIAIKLGYTNIMPIEISCGQLIEAAKKMGCWQEADNYTPLPADAILYDWDDNGVGDNRGWPDHVGIVEKVSNGSFTVIEGNKGNVVGRRTVKVNAKCIRGFITPKYDDQKRNPRTEPLPAKRFDKALSGIYACKEANKHCRIYAGKNYKSICKVPVGTKVQCYGYYDVKASANQTKWLFVEFQIGKENYSGYMAQTGLKKVK